MWFTETPWPPIVVCSILAVLFVVGWSANKRAVYIFSAAGMIFLCGVIYVVEQNIITESERVEAAVHGVTRAFADLDSARTLDFFSSQDVTDRLSVSAALKLVTRIELLRVTDVQIEMLSQQTRAVSHFRANATLSVVGYGNVGRKPTRWKLTWQLEEGEWKIINVTRLNPINGKEMSTLTQAEQ
jgi:hypothetical protein